VAFAVVDAMITLCEASYEPAGGVNVGAAA
jgi:hypothetical protein